MGEGKLDASSLKSILGSVNISKLNIDSLKNSLKGKGWESEVIEGVISEVITSNQTLDYPKLKQIYVGKTLTNMSNDELISKMSDEIKDYHKQGISDKLIKDFFLKKQIQLSIIDGAFKKADEEKKYWENYHNSLVGYIMPFIECGYNEFYIKRQFKANGWRSENIDKAFEQASRQLFIENKSKFLESEILHRLVSGENKTHVVSVLQKKGWPEDILKSVFEDISVGLFQFEESLHGIDLNEYNLSEIKKVLVAKNWPLEIIDYTLSKISDKVDYHRNLYHLRNEVAEMVEKGKSVKFIEKKLDEENISRDIADKLILQINLDLIKQGDREKLKKFNKTNFKRKNAHNITDLLSDLKSNKTNDLLIKHKITKKQRQKMSIHS